MAISIVIIEVLNTGGNTYGKLKSPQGRHCELHLRTLRLEIMEYKAEKKSVMNLKVSFCVTQPSACRSLEAEGQRIPMHSTSSCLTANEKRGRTKSAIQYAEKRLCLFNQVNSKGATLSHKCLLRESRRIDCLLLVLFGD